MSIKVRNASKGKGESHTNVERKKLSSENAFYFFTSIGNYTGESAASLEDFLEKIEHVDIKSLEFHLYRGDFERWVAGTLGDKGLAEEIKNLHAQNLIGENLMHACIIQAMREIGIDISKNQPKLLNTQMAQEADVIIVMGCGAQGICPAPLLNKVVDWELEDPKGKPIEKVREIRGEIEKRVKKLINEIA